MRINIFLLERMITWVCESGESAVIRELAVWRRWSRVNVWIHVGISREGMWHHREI